MTACPGLTFSDSMSAESSRALFDSKRFIGYRGAVEWDIILLACIGTRRSNCGGRARSAMRMVEEIIMME